MEASAAEQGRPVLAINLDESPVPAVATHTAGNVPRDARGRQAAAASPEPALPEPTQPVRKGTDRQNFTLVAMICSESWLQPLMPQVLLGKRKLLIADAGIAAAGRVARKGGPLCEKENRLHADARGRARPHARAS